MTVQSISTDTSLHPQDIALTFMLLGFLRKSVDNKFVLAVDWAKVDAHMGKSEAARKKGTRIDLDPEALRWTPVISGHDLFRSPFKERRVSGASSVSSPLKSPSSSRLDGGNASPTHMPQSPMKKRRRLGSLSAAAAAAKTDTTTTTTDSEMDNESSNSKGKRGRKKGAVVGRKKFGGGGDKQPATPNSNKSARGRKPGSANKKTASGECEGMDGGALNNISTEKRNQQIRTAAEERAEKKRHNQLLPKKQKKVSTSMIDSDDEEENEAAGTKKNCSDSPSKQDKKAAAPAMVARNNSRVSTEEDDADDEGDNDEVAVPSKKKSPMAKKSPKKEAAVKSGSGGPTIRALDFDENKRFGSRAAARRACDRISKDSKSLSSDEAEDGEGPAGAPPPAEVVKAEKPRNPEKRPVGRPRKKPEEEKENVGKAGGAAGAGGSSGGGGTAAGKQLSWPEQLARIKARSAPSRQTTTTSDSGSQSFLDEEDEAPLRPKKMGRKKTAQQTPALESKTSGGGPIVPAAVASSTPKRYGLRGQRTPSKRLKDFFVDLPDRLTP